MIKGLLIRETLFVHLFILVVRPCSDARYLDTLFIQPCSNVAGHFFPAWLPDNEMSAAGKFLEIGNGVERLYFL